MFSGGVWELYLTDKDRKLLIEIIEEWQSDDFSTDIDKLNHVRYLLNVLRTTEHSRWRHNT